MRTQRMSPLERFDATLRWLAVAVVVAVIGAAVLLPNTGLAALRRQFPQFSQLLSWLDHAMPSVDLVHVICFAALTVCVFFAWRSAAWRLKLGALLGLAAVSEFVQFWVPGRRPSWNDFFDDLAGIAVGALIWGLVYAVQRLTKPRRYAPRRR
jgi:VanZ family protein